MTTVTLHNINAARTIEIVQELRQTLRQHADFDYRFMQGGYNWDTNQTHAPMTDFTFYNPADATAFSLRYL